MQTKGFVLVLCLLFALLISALALGALVLSELSSRFNLAGLQQKRQAMSAEAKMQSPVENASQPVTLPQCPAQFQVWPAHWQQCRLLRAEQADLNQNSVGQIQLIWQVDPYTHGGEL
ncbi:MAG: hypothetical protein U5L02_13910 [Rheinheimera sp.]|nr:hypothetical protein [Rheinheimera sp.]